jgi:hypothetical protein
MCKLRETLKLCTCDVPTVSALEHHWVLYRFDKEKNNMVIGRVMLPDRLHAKIDAHNRRLLLARLQEEDAFDVDLHPEEGDRLAITFRCSEADASGRRVKKTITYGYARMGGRWVEERYDPLSWQWHHDQEQFGELRPAT